MHTSTVKRFDFSWLQRVALINVFVLLISVVSFANTTGDNDKKTEKKKEGKKVETSIDSKSDLEVKEVQEASNKDQTKAYSGRPAYKSENYIEADSLNNQSGSSVVTFNFIQYIIQSVKFSDEVY